MNDSRPESEPKEATPNEVAATDAAPNDATALLVRIEKGDEAAARELLPIVYAELRRVARSQFARQGAGHTLEPTALVHEAYMKLVRHGGEWKDRTHFFAVAATAMRQVLMNHAEARRAKKRDGVRVDVTMDGLSTPDLLPSIDLLALDDALCTLASLDETDARIVDLRFFGGLTMDEVARVVGLSTRAVEKRWRRTRAWLNHEMSRGAR